jgi:hypothetical protein
MKIAIQGSTCKRAMHVIIITELMFRKIRQKLIKIMPNIGE